MLHVLGSWEEVGIQRLLALFWTRCAGIGIYPGAVTMPGCGCLFEGFSALFMHVFGWLVDCHLCES